MSKRDWRSGVNFGGLHRAGAGNCRDRSSDAVADRNSAGRTQHWSCWSRSLGPRIQGDRRRCDEDGGSLPWGMDEMRKTDETDRNRPSTGQACVTACWQGSTLWENVSCKKVFTSQSLDLARLWWNLEKMLRSLETKALWLWLRVRVISCYFWALGQRAECFGLNLLDGWQWQTAKIVCSHHGFEDLSRLDRRTDFTYYLNQHLRGHILLGKASKFDTHT